MESNDKKPESQNINTSVNHLYLSSQTIRFFKHFIDTLEYRGDFAESIDFENITNIEPLQKLLLDLDKLAYEKLDDYQKHIIEDIERFRNYPYRHIPYIWVYNSLITYNEVLETTKIDEENSISLEETKYIIRPNLVLSLLAYIEIPSFEYNVLDLENDGHGYHFHYCNATKKGPARTSMLLTFNPKDILLNINTHKLYAEYHGENKYISIDISKIGEGKAKAIYDICLEKGIKRGIQYFKMPSDKSKEFYPINQF